MSNEPSIVARVRIGLNMELCLSRVNIIYFVDYSKRNPVYSRIGSATDYNIQKMVNALITFRQLANGKPSRIILSEED